MAINNSRTRFAVGTESLDVIVRNGKSGIAVFARAKSAGYRAVIGSRIVTPDAEVAQKHADALIAEAEANGWVRRSSSGGGATASKFTSIPKPGALPASAPLAGKAEKPASAKPEAGKGGKAAPGKK